MLLARAQVTSSLSSPSSRAAYYLLLRHRYFCSYKSWWAGCHLATPLSPLEGGIPGAARKGGMQRDVYQPADAEEQSSVRAVGQLNI